MKRVSELTGQSISHGGAWNVIQALGNKTKEEEIEQIKRLERSEICGEKDRPSKGRKLEMKVAVAYEGWEQVSKDRFQLVNKIACAGFENASLFHKKKEAMIAKEYNIDDIKIRILNGDGAPWIQQGMWNKCG